MAMPGAVTSNTRYVVHTHFSVNQNVAGLANIENRLQRLNRVVNAVGRSFAVITAGVGIRRLAGAFVSIHTEIEDAKVGLAGLMTAITSMPMPVALERAAAAVTSMRKAAREGPGDLPEYMQALQGIYSKVVRGGGTQANAENLARLAVVANYALNATGKKATLPIDVGQALSQGIGSYTTRHLNELLGAVDPKFADPGFFNKLNYKDRLDLVTQALERMQDAALALGKTWSAQTDTLRDNLREIGRQASSGLFDTLKLDLINLNKLILDNTDEINNWANGIDRALINTYKLSKATVRDGEFRQNALQIGAGGVGAFAGRQAGVMANAALIAKGIPGFGQIINVMTFIGAAIGNVMAKYPKDTEVFLDALTRMFSAIGRLIAGITQVVLGNPVVEAVVLSGIRFLTTILYGLTIFFNILYEIVQVLQWFSDSMPNMLALNANFATSASQLAKDSFDIRWNYNPTTPMFMPYDPYFGHDPVGRTPLDLESYLYPPESIDDECLYDERDLKGPGDTNLNGPITIIIKAERVDNPDLVARSFREAAERMTEFRRGGRSVLVPKPG